MNLPSLKAENVISALALLATVLKRLEESPHIPL